MTRGRIPSAALLVALTLTSACSSGTDEGPDPLPDTPSTTGPDSSGPVDPSTTRPPGPLDPTDPDYPTIPPRPSVTYPATD